MTRRLTLLMLSLPMGMMAKNIPRQADCTTTKVLAERTVVSLAPVETIALGPGGLNGPNSPVTGGSGGTGSGSGAAAGGINGPNSAGGSGTSGTGPGAVNGPNGVLPGDAGTGSGTGNGPIAGAGGSGVNGNGPGAVNGPNGAGGPGGGPPYTTVYPVVVDSFGPNGVEQRTFLVTELCDTWPCHARPTGECPPGFTTTVATCPTACGAGPVTSTMTVPGGETPPVEIQTYERVYDYFCPTGLASSTYVLTQTCDYSAGCQVPPSSEVPPSFTAVQTVCDTGCGPTPITAVLTVPVTPAPSPPPAPPGPPPPATGTEYLCPGPGCAPVPTDVVIAGAPRTQQAAGTLGFMAGALALPFVLARVF